MLHCLLPLVLGTVETPSLLVMYKDGPASYSLDESPKHLTVLVQGKEPIELERYRDTTQIEVLVDETGKSVAIWSYPRDKGRICMLNVSNLRGKPTQKKLPAEPIMSAEWRSGSLLAWTGYLGAVSSKPIILFGRGNTVKALPPTLSTYLSSAEYRWMREAVGATSASFFAPSNGIFIKPPLLPNSFYEVPTLGGFSRTIDRIVLTDGSRIIVGSRQKGAVTTTHSAMVAKDRVFQVGQTRTKIFALQSLDLGRFEIVQYTLQLKREATLLTGAIGKFWVME